MTNFRTIPKGRYIFSAIVISLIAFAWIFGLVDTQETYNELRNNKKLDSIYMRIEPSVDSVRDVAITNDSVLAKLNQTFKDLQEFFPDTPKMHSILIDMSIYKNRKGKLLLLKTTYSGWVIDLGGTYYQDDSLISVLDRYMRLDSLK